MSLKIDRVQLEIIVKQDTARQQMMQLEEQMRAANKELNSIKKQFGKNSDEYRAQEQVIKGLKIEYDKLFEQIGIGKLNLKELANRQRELNAILRNLDPSLPEWKEYNTQLTAINSRVKELKMASLDTGLSLSKVADGFNKYAAIGASAIASLTGVALTARKCVDEYAEMEEAEAQVMKYTGMTKEEVKGLNEEFKAMDTRTSREKLNALAGDAGRLGITGKKNILEFVDAADKINVALGEDLGEDAVKNIGKLAQMFGEDEKLGLRGAMLATGSAINEVAQNSSAAEAYLVGFTSRVAGAANQAKVAQGNILGYASVLDQNMQQQEMAATAFQTLMMKMYQEPAKFAKIAGQSVAEFSTLIKTDANEAILQFLDTLNKKGGLDQLAPMFKEMGLDGVRASGVISTMAGKIDDIRTAQKLANEAYRDGTSSTKEFNVQNNTVQAGLEKAKKDFKDIRVELGEKLQPVMKHMISTGSMTVKGLGAVVSILLEYRKAIVVASAAVAVYTLTVKGDMLIRSAWLGITKACTVATHLFNGALKANPLGIVASILAGVVTSLAIFRTKTNEATEAQQKLNEKLERYETLMGRIHSIKSNVNNLDLLDEEQKQRLKSEAKASISELNDRMVEEMAVQRKWHQEEKTEKIKRANGNKEIEKILLGSLENQLKERLKVYGSYAVKKKELEAILEKLPQDEIIIEDDKCPKCGNKPCTCKQSGLDKELKDREDKLTQEMHTERNLWKEKYLNQMTDEAGYQKALSNAEMMYLLKRKALLESYGKDTTDIQGQIYDKMIAESNRLYQAAQEADKNVQSDLLGLLEEDYQNDRRAAKEAYLNGDIKTEADYQERLKEMEEDYLQQRKDMLLAYGEDVSAIDEQILDKQLKQMKDAEDKATKLQEAKNQRDKDDYYTRTNDEFTNLAIDGLQLLFDQKKHMWETEEEFEERIKDKKLRGIEIVAQAASLASAGVQALQDREISKVTRKYDKEIKAAKKAGKDTTKLEEEKEEAINQVKKKYADKQFAAAALQIVATTAMAAIQAYNAVVGIVPVGPVLAPIAAAAAVAAGMAQLASAKQARDEAKGLKEGGYLHDYVEGYTSSGNPDDVAGVIPVHKDEFVTNHEGVANPHVRQFLDVFDVAQKNGSIRMINTTQILEQVRTRSGKYSGGYSDNHSSSSQSFAGSSSATGLSPELRSQIVELLIKTNELLVEIRNKELVVDPRKVRDGIKNIEKLESNVSRR